MPKAGRKNGRRKLGRMLQVAGALIIVAGLAYGLVIGPMPYGGPGAPMAASVVMLIAGLSVGVFAIGLIAFFAGVAMSRSADARFGEPG